MVKLIRNSSFWLIILVGSFFIFKLAAYLISGGFWSFLSGGFLVIVAALLSLASVFALGTNFWLIQRRHQFKFRRSAPTQNIRAKRNPMIIPTSKGEFSLHFMHYRNPSDPATQGSIQDFMNEVHVPRKHVVVGTTECWINNVPGADPLNLEHASRGISGITSTDRFVRATGRKNALARALANAAKVNPLFADKDFRREIWDGYNSR